MGRHILVKMKGQRKRGEVRLCRVSVSIQLKLQELTVDGFADNVGAKCKLGYFIYQHTFIYEDYKPNNVWLQHFFSNFFQSHDPSLSDAPHPKPCYVCVSTSSFLHIHPEVTYCNNMMFRQSAYEVGKT